MSKVKWEVIFYSVFTLVSQKRLAKRRPLDLISSKYIWIFKKESEKVWEALSFPKYLKMLINVYSDFVALGRCVLSSQSRSLQVTLSVDLLGHVGK